MKYKIIIIGAICFFALSPYASEDSAFTEKAGELDIGTSDGNHLSTSDPLDDFALSEDNTHASSQEEKGFQQWVISGFNQFKDGAVNLFEDITGTFFIDNLSSQAQEQQVTPFLYFL